MGRYKGRFKWSPDQVLGLSLGHSVYRVRVVLCGDRFQREYQTDGLRMAVWCFGLRRILSHIQDWQEQLL